MATITNTTRKTLLHPHAGFARTMLSQSIGMMFRKPKNQAIIFDFGSSRTVRMHMFFVFGPLDIIVLDDAGYIMACTTLNSWQVWHPGIRSSCVIELPPGTLQSTQTRLGDRVTIAE